MLQRRPGPNSWRGGWAHSRPVWALIAVASLTLILYTGHYFMQHRLIAHQDGHSAGMASVVSSMERLRYAANVLDPTAMKLAPGEYELKFKNPCWWTTITSARGEAEQLNCLPYAFVTGFYTGVGSLVDKLNVHPNVIKDAGPIGIWGTSFGYWSEHRNDFASYLGGIYATGGTPLSLQRDPATNIIIDSSRSTFYLYQACSSHVHRAFLSVAVAEWKKCHDKHTSGPLYEQCMDQEALPRGRAADYKAAADAGIDYQDQQLPLLLRAIYGQRIPKLVLMVRNPIHRMYSNYMGVKNMWERHGNTTQRFTKFVNEQLAAWRACLDGNTTGGLDGAGGPAAPHTDWNCYMNFETLSMREEAVFYHCDQLFRGLYAPYLKVWLRFFPRDHVLVVKASAYFKDPDTITNKVLDFLGLPLLPALETATLASQGGDKKPTLTSDSRTGGFLDQDAAAKVRAAGLPPRSNIKGVAPMEEATRLALLEFFAPYNRQLAELLGDPSILAWNTDKDAV